MRAHFGLPSVEAAEDEGRPPIKVKFEIPYFTVSGIQVRLDVIIFLEQLRHVCQKCVHVNLSEDLHNMLSGFSKKIFVTKLTTKLQYNFI